MMLVFLSCSSQFFLLFWEGGDNPTNKISSLSSANLPPPHVPCPAAATPRNLSSSHLLFGFFRPAQISSLSFQLLYWVLLAVSLVSFFPCILAVQEVGSNSEREREREFCEPTSPIHIPQKSSLIFYCGHRLETNWLWRLNISLVVFAADYLLYLERLLLYVSFEDFAAKGLEEKSVFFLLLLEGLRWD